jgi:hypothetical protein
MLKGTGLKKISADVEKIIKAAKKVSTDVPEKKE